MEDINGTNNETGSNMNSNSLFYQSGNFASSGNQTTINSATVNLGRGQPRGQNWENLMNPSSQYRESNA